MVYGDNDGGDDVPFPFIVFYLNFVYKQIFLLVDLLCCGAVLFPVIW
jgi:hypothetical protein